MGPPLWILHRTLGLTLAVLGLGLFSQPVSAYPLRDSALDILSCGTSTDERFQECHDRMEAITNAERLEASVYRTLRAHSARDTSVSRPDRRGFFAGLGRVARFVLRNMKAFVVPKARVVMGLPHKDTASRLEPSPVNEDFVGGSPVLQRASIDAPFCQIDPVWAFEHASPGAFDARARAWQRGYARLTSDVTLEPALETDNYGMALSVRF